MTDVYLHPNIAPSAGINDVIIYANGAGGVIAVNASTLLSANSSLTINSALTEFAQTNLVASSSLVVVPTSFGSSNLVSSSSLTTNSVVTEVSNNQRIANQWGSGSTNIGFYANY
jgi:hypothetical protein